MDGERAAVPLGDSVHGEKGVYYGGDWLAMEDCVGPSAKWCAGCPETPRAPPAASGGDDEVYDVVVVGAGCVGASVARELSRSQLRVCLFEAADDVTQGATKANSGIVHAGYDDKPGSVRAKFCWTGNQMYPRLDRELRFGYRRTGSLVVAYGEEEERLLDELMERGRQNKVENLRIVDQAELRQLEPNISREATKALLSPDAGIVTPYEFTIAVAENAAENGVEVCVNTKVVGVTKHPAKPSGEEELFSVETRRTRPDDSAAPKFVAAGALAAAAASAACFLNGLLAASMLCVVLSVAAVLFALRKPAPAAGRTLQARFIVNSAGLKGDAVARLIGDDSFEIRPRIGEYLLLHKNQGRLVRHVLFPCPGKMGKGVVVQPTLWGNLLLGPTARDLHDPATAKATAREIMTYLISKCRHLVPHFDAGHVIHSFAGCRAKNTTGDWVVRPSHVEPRFVHATGIDSPGLAGSPAVAVEVVRLLAAAGLELRPDPGFQPHRRSLIRPKHVWRDLKKGDPDPARNVICICEKVTEAEIVDAVHRPLEVASTQAVRKRTRAGMGHCQGKRCEHLVQAVLARELGTSSSRVPGRPWPESSLLPQRWLSDAEKEELRRLG